MKQRAGIANKPNHLNIGSDTTFVPGPVSDDGTIDYAAAINQKMRAEIKREENAAVWIIRALGPNVPEFKCEPNLFEELGMQRPPVHGDYLQPEHPKPAYLKQIPTDIVTDKPLLYQRIDEGYLLYSVGPNRKDDTGRTHLSRNFGDDLTIRMVLPSTD
ncbi:hypothetical protein OAF83_01760 [Rubripirellula sp.]|jgi:hypothetical protein|nr:hypothetical protein [Rubripirellula sp.]MDB4749608.1 hypothetical protein [Rubripirellula sp.]